jgi:hypothetical protein
MSERDFLEALGDHKCDAGMSVENGPAVVNIRNVLLDSKPKQGNFRG